MTTLKTFRKILATLVLAAVAGGAGLGTADSARAGEFVVLVNAANDAPGGDAGKAEVARLFLKRASEWSNGLRAFPFDRPADSAVHEAFVSEILNSDGSSLNDWWARLKQTRGETPPREVGSLRFLLRALTRREGAFGFAAKKAVQPLPDGIRILFEFG